jgi:hypothetical protein
MVVPVFGMIIPACGMIIVVPVFGMIVVVPVSGKKKTDSLGLSMIKNVEGEGLRSAHREQVARVGDGRYERSSDNERSRGERGTRGIPAKGAEGQETIN